MGKSLPHFIRILGSWAQHRPPRPLFLHRFAMMTSLSDLNAPEQSPVYLCYQTERMQDIRFPREVPISIRILLSAGKIIYTGSAFMLFELVVMCQLSSNCRTEPSLPFISKPSGAKRKAMGPSALFPWKMIPILEALRQLCIIPTARLTHPCSTGSTDDTVLDPIN